MNRCVRRVIHGFSVPLIFCLMICAAYGQPPAPSKEGKGPAPRKAPSDPQLTGIQKGAFNIYVEDQLKGTEEFGVEPAGNEFVARGKIHLTITRDEKPVQYYIDTELNLKPNFDPIRYSMVQKFEGNTSSIKMTFQDGKATADFSTSVGTEKRDYQLAPGVALLDDNIFHHYALLAERYDYEKGGLQEFPAFIPQESIGGVLHIIYKGDENVDVGGKSMAVQHLLVDTNDLKLDLYVEGNQHRLVKMEVPSSKVVVVLQKG
ncbi:MAG: hypothetical protein LAO21_15395 [Acidobacteriia bacterium]|nr:hypothetical protein [Terriglobia bacterium]